MNNLIFKLARDFLKSRFQKSFRPETEEVELIVIYTKCGDDTNRYEIGPTGVMFWPDYTKEIR